MKKQLIVIVLIVIGLTTVGCQTILGVTGTNAVDKEGILTTDAENIEIASDTISDYYPFLENTILDYTGEGNEYAKQQVYFEFIEGDRAQLKVINSGTNMIRILEHNNGTLTEVYNEGEFYHIENMLNQKSEKQNIILKEPLEVGNAWVTKEGYIKEITGIEVEVETPYKILNALEVTTTLDESRIQRNYYVKGLGLVASVYNDGEYEVKTVLNNIIKEQPLNQEIQVFYPMFDDNRTVFVNDNISFYTNVSIEKLLEDKLKHVPSDKLVSPLPNSAIINKISLERATWTVNADFSEELLMDMNAGASFETEIIKSLVNTLGKFYDTDKVYITVNGSPYQSGHYAIREGEYFKVDLEDIVLYK